MSKRVNTAAQQALRKQRSHSEKAKACLSLMGDFIRDATALYQSLSK